MLETMQKLLRRNVEKLEAFMMLRLILTGSSKINGAKLNDTCSVRANWLCMGWPYCLAETRREFQTGGNFFSTTLYTDDEDML